MQTYIYTVYLKERKIAINRKFAKPYATIPSISKIRKIHLI